MTKKKDEDLVKLTKTVVEALPYSDKQKFIRDSELTGFGIRVGKSSKSYFVEKRVQGKNSRKIFCSAEHFAPEEARKRAQTLLGLMADGVNLVDADKKKRMKSETLQTAFKKYLEVRSLKPSTVDGMTYMVERVFADWVKKPLTDISRDMVLKRHQKLKSENGKVQADNAMRALRTVFNFAIAHYMDENEEPIIQRNPVKVLSDTKAWHKKTRRQTRIEEHDMAAWFQAVASLRNNENTDKAEVVRDYLFLEIMTGLRRNEAAKLKWSDVDLKARKLTIKETKNGNVHVMPLSDLLVQLLTYRKSRAASVFVFPGEGDDGYIKEPRRHAKTVIKESGVKFMVHDLRRNFTTAAHSLNTYYQAKRLCNHTISQSDVADGYNVITLEQLRQPMQRITDYFLSAAGIDKAAMTNYETFLLRAQQQKTLHSDGLLLGS